MKFKSNTLKPNHMLKILCYIIVGWIIFSVLSTESDPLSYAIIGIIVVLLIQTIEDEFNL
jgi:hypothetical protein